MKVVKKVENAYGIMNGVKTKLDGHIISINDYPNELVQKQIKLNHLASQFRDLANKLESHTNFNQDLKSFLTKHSLEMNLTQEEAKKDANERFKNKASNRLNARRKAEKRLQISAYKKEVGCKVCGYNENPDILHFHHRDPNEKITNVSRMVGKNHSMERIKKEIDKCDLLCISCHHKEHGIENVT